MKLNYQLTNVCGVVYKQGNIAFTPDDGLVTAVGSRVTRYDLGSGDGSARTSEYEALGGGEFERIAVSDDGRVMVAVDGSGKLVLSTTTSQHVLGRLNLPTRTTCAAFNPSSTKLAIAVGRLIQIWRVPGAGRKVYMAFELEKTMAAGGAGEGVGCLAWSPCGRFIACGGADMTLRVLQVDGGKGVKPFESSGHRHTIVGVHWTASDGDGPDGDGPDGDGPDGSNKTDGPNMLHSVSREGVVKGWQFNPVTGPTLHSSAHLRLTPADTEDGNDSSVERRPWVTAVSFKRNLLLAGFINGAFGLFTLLDGPTDPSIPSSLPLVYALSLGNLQVDACAINESGEWLAFASASLGQLLVWEWRSETYVMKQQGHVAESVSAAFSPDGQSFATGGADGRVKIWGVGSGLSHQTFNDHRGSVTSVQYVGRSSSRSTSTPGVLLSASTDGTVRAWDLHRSRPFRIMASPSAVQFSALAVDPAGEIVAAGTMDTHQIFVWSLQTGDLLETIEGHTGPISALAFNPSGTTLASASWDKSVRCWNLFSRDRQPSDPMTHQHDVLAIAWRPDGAHLVAATLGGDLAIWDVDSSQVVGTIEAKRDISTKRMDSTRFSSVAYSPDGRAIFASGTFPGVAVYSADGPSRLLLRTIHQSTVNNRDYTREDKEVLEPSVLSIAPTGRAIALLRPHHGCALFRLDEGLLFDPADLDTDCTPAAIHRAIRKGDHLRALIMSFRLGLEELQMDVWSSVPPPTIPILIPALPLHHLPALLSLLATILSTTGSKSIELALRWLTATLQAHGLHLKASARITSGLPPTLRALHKAVHQARSDLAAPSHHNLYALRLLLQQ